MEARKYARAYASPRTWGTAPAGADAGPATRTRDWHATSTLEVRSARELAAVSADVALAASDTDVDLSGNRLAASKAACLAKLALFGTVSRLCVAGCGLSDAHFQSFLPTLRLAGVRVGRLDVSHNMLSSGGARALSAYIASAAGRSTHTLRIRSVRMRRVGCNKCAALTCLCLQPCERVHVRATAATRLAARVLAPSLGQWLAPLRCCTSPRRRVACEPKTRWRWRLPCAPAGRCTAWTSVTTQLWVTLAFQGWRPACTVPHLSPTSALARADSRREVSTSSWPG